MDYSVRDSLTEKVYGGRTKKFTKQELKDKIKEKWDEELVTEICNAISSGRNRLRLVDSKNGGSIHHFLI